MMERAHAQYPAGVPTEIEPVNHAIDDLLERATRDCPNRVAIDFLGREYTYSEVYTEVQRAARVLRMCGVRRGDVVSVILPNCPQHYVAFYAIIAIGAIVSEHNPLAPAATLQKQLDQVGANVVVAWEKTIERLFEEPIFPDERTFLAVDLRRALPLQSQLLLKLPIKAARTQREKLSGRAPSGVHSWDNQVKNADPLNVRMIESAYVEDTAVLIQTGGTTGTPKAVELTHQSLLSNTQQADLWMLGFERGKETVAAVLPFFHAFGLQLSMLICVNKAATQVMLPRFDIDTLFAAHKRHPITFFGGVPPMFKRILDAKNSGKEVDLTSISRSISGAMALNPQLAHDWEKATGGFIVEGYGMTEASPVLCGSPFSPARIPSTLGIPFPSTEAKVVSQEDHSIELGEGEVGELAVRGPQIFRGYWNNPEETAAALEDGWLYTGDLARWEDGFLVMADRRKEMIITGGFNVYPSEVESAVREMPGVADVAVVGMSTDSFTESVVAALVLEPGAKVSLEDIRRWTEDKLSHYAMPRSIAVLDELPRSQIGKVMRRSVKEILSSFELSGSEWKRKIMSATARISKDNEEPAGGNEEEPTAESDSTK